MSTKAIHRALAALDGLPAAFGLGDVVRDALEEVGAIERAAITLTGFTYDGMPEAMPRGSPTGNLQRSAMAVLQQIRSDAPRESQ